MHEFDLVELIRRRVVQARADVSLGIGDDSAVLDLPAGRQLVACTDTLVAGVHFLADTAPEHIGWKSLAVNLSDLAAMGAEPAWALLALTLPDGDPRFVECFADGFAKLARAYDVALVGGDTTQGPLSVTVTALGSVPNGHSLTRGGARVGDAVFVTGTLGDAAGALRLSLPQPPFMAGKLRGAEGGWGELLERMHRPQPRLAAGLALRGLANACIDVSDGLLADLGHVCDESGVAAELDADAVPLSAALRATFDTATCRELALAGGDDYELCFTAPAAREKETVAALQQARCRATRIGRIVAGDGVRALDAHGGVLAMPHQGWEHFSP